jgi:hypothetical protein
MKTLIAVVLTALSIWGAAVARADNDQSSTPSPPAAPPTPAPVVATGGANTGTNPGSSCIPHLGLRNQPLPPGDALEPERRRRMAVRMARPGAVCRPVHRTHGELQPMNRG